MNWKFTANSPDELAKVGNKLLGASRQQFLDEQVQMSRLLEGISTTPLFEYPVRVRHTGAKGVPDFQIEAGGRRIAIELAKITVQDVEHARGLQRGGLKQTLGISSLFLKKSKPRTVGEVFEEGFSNQPFRFGVSPKELNEIWLREVETQLNEKTVVLQRNQFEHGDEDWLVLCDQIGTDESEIKSRVEILTRLLALRWQPGWFSRVFVQQIELFPFVAGFAESGIIAVPEEFREANSQPSAWLCFFRRPGRVDRLSAE